MKYCASHQGLRKILLVEKLDRNRVLSNFRLHSHPNLAPEKTYLNRTKTQRMLICFIGKVLITQLNFWGYGLNNQKYSIKKACLIT